MHTGIAAIDSLGLPLPRLLLLAMSAGSAAKQVFWLTVLCNENFPVPMAATVSTYNGVVNTLNTLLYLAAATSSSLASPQISIPESSQTLGLPLVLGAALYTIGISIETISELQRKWFKDRPENKGKICGVGLWRFARHINYGGYILWRTGFALAAGGWLPAALIGDSKPRVFLGVESITWTGT